MQYKRFENTVVLRLDPNEEVLEQLAALAMAEHIRLAEVSGLGALKELHICLFDPATKQFCNNVYEELLELLSLTGTVTKQNGGPYLHIHASAANARGNVYGGHLKRAVISATGEIIIRIIDGVVGRVYNEEIGLNLFHFEDSPSAF